MPWALRLLLLAALLTHLGCDDGAGGDGDPDAGPDLVSTSPAAGNDGSGDTDASTTSRDAVTLHLSSEITAHDATRTVHVEVRASLALTATVVAGSETLYEGMGEIETLEISLSEEGCTLEVTQDELLPTSARAQLVFDEDSGRTELFVDPGRPTETVRGTCPSGTVTETRSTWASHYEALHRDELHPPAASAGYRYRIAEGWMRGASLETLTELVLDGVERELDGWSYTETTRWWVE